jgi:deazaflavin-dependent oxidoreductase (nitroreductase family)
LRVDLDRIATGLNPVVGWILRSPLHGLLSRGLVLLTISGRRSGRRYSIPVGYQRDAEGIVVLVSRARRKRWWRNFREPGAVTLRLRGRDVAGEARVVAAGSPAFRAAFETTLRRLPSLARQFDVRFDPREGLDAAALAALAREAVVIRIAIVR